MNVFEKETGQVGLFGIVWFDEMSHGKTKIESRPRISLENKISVIKQAGDQPRYAGDGTSFDWFTLPEAHVEHGCQDVDLTILQHEKRTRI